MASGNLGRTTIDWSGFSKCRDEDTNKIVGAKCRNCDRILHSVSEKRLTIHRNSCKGRHQNRSPNEWQTGQNVFAPENANMEDSYSVDNEDFGEIKRIIDDALGKFFFSCNISFMTVTKPYFIQFIEQLIHYAAKIPNFSYKPPCRDTLATTILRRIYEETQEEKRELLNDTECVLQVDGWKNSETNKKFLVFSLTNFRVPLLFLRHYDISLEDEYGETLSEYINDAIVAAKELYGAKVVSAISDNDSKIVCGIRMAKTADNKPLIRCTCNSHSGNLLIKSTADLEFLKILREVIHAFSTPKIESLIKDRYHGTKLKNFPETRWCYIRNSCKCIQKNFDIMRSIIRLPDHGIDDTICEVVNGPDFENEINHIINVLDPICILINKCQDPTVNIADATDLWLKLQLPTEQFLEEITNRIKKAVWPVGYAANYLHHKYKGLRLNQDQMKIAQSFFLDHLDADSLKELEHFQTNRESLNDLANKCTSPIAFWGYIDHVYKKLAKFAKSILIIPASTAKLEGLFSEWSYVHNSYRNRLGDTTSSQLIDVYSYMNQPHYPKKRKHSLVLED